MQNTKKIYDMISQANLKRYSASVVWYAIHIKWWNKWYKSNHHIVPNIDNSVLIGGIYDLQNAPDAKIIVLDFKILFDVFIMYSLFFFDILFTFSLVYI